MKTAKSSRDKFRKRDLFGWLVMLPSLLLFAFFVWEPLLENIRLSFFSTKMYDVVEFIGLKNYQTVINDVDFMASFKNTFSYTLWSLVIGFFVPMIIGILISETVHLKGFFRMAVYFPNIMPSLATIWIWSYFFLPGPTGVLNILFGQAGNGTF